MSGYLYVLYQKEASMLWSDIVMRAYNGNCFLLIICVKFALYETGVYKVF